MELSICGHFSQVDRDIRKRTKIFRARFYNKIWVEAQQDLMQLLQQEIPDAPPKPEKDRMVVAQQLGTLYVRYLQIFRNLELAYDQITHPQKKRVIRLVLDGVMGRILELKDELVELEISEFHYFDDILQDLKLGPESLEIPIPKYFIKEKIKVLKDREQILSQILERSGAKETDVVKQLKPMSLDEAVRVIQVSERARQGRLRAKFMREIHLEEKRERMAKLQGEKVLDPDLAALRIQKVWRGYIQRKKTKQQREEEMIFLGMVPPAHFNKISMAEVIAKKTEALRSDLQEQYEADYQNALVQIRDTIRETEGLDIKETLQDQIRQWFIECRHATGKFPDFPDEEDGGSKAVFAQKTPEQVAAELAAKEEAKDKKKKEKGKKEKGKKKTKKEKDKAKGKKGKGKEEEEEPGWKMNPSKFLPDVSSATNTYEGVWKNRNESWNLHQTHDSELIKEDKRKEVEEEIRIQVDELMRQELQNLKLAVDRDKNKKKKGKKGGKKKKKGKKSGKRKKKKEKDLTPDRTIDSLYEELVTERLLVKPKPVKLSDFIGEYSYLGTTLRQADIEPMPSLSDVKQLLVLYGVLPLGCESVHEKAPQVKALLLAGPAGVGKKMLVNAICNETGANLFNLSPANISGKYPGKSGLQMMLHMVLKVARQLQPSVIWIEDAEKMFYKKVPKTEKQLDPKRLKKDLPKLLKSIKPEDRILVVGTSQRPFDAEIKPLTKVYKKIVLVPRPDYAARLVLWKQLISQQAESTTSLNYSALAKITDGFTPGHMVQAVDTVLNERRIRQFSQKPLAAAEFLGSLSRQEPVYKEEEEAFKTWYSKTPLGKKRSKAKPDAEEETGKDKGKKKGAKKGKKK
ncbi:dynein regulatory complex protein 11 isoform X1 [Bufo gargarizans]|uniref:dynein regulatory complex protein 11 isoform X1 n=1 Tax=Bufo gargarizans TaxID=30331 RepID=UPI001CF4BD23|nr:dynein regulatory complex protein 11 isoform X1 [Bufo gargarizans]XP_044159920.1 dynein regulatory complex protein 11 isoform X1 [Bufo gargarizans]